MRIKLKVFFNLFVLIILCVFNIDAQIKTNQDSIKYKKIGQYRQFYGDHLPKQNGTVNDFENLYTPKEKYTLDSIIEDFKIQSNIEIVIVTIDSICVAKENFESLTLKLAREWKVGNNNSNRGILIGISKGCKKMRIQNSDSIVNIISDTQTKLIIDSCFIPSFKQNLYYDGTLLGTIKLMGYIDLIKKWRNIKWQFDSLMFLADKLMQSSLNENEKVLFKIDSLAKIMGEKGNSYSIKAHKSKEICDGFVLYIENIKNTILQKAGGRNENQELKYPYSENIVHNYFLNKKDNQTNGKELVLRINTTRIQLLNILDPSEQKEIETFLTTVDKQYPTDIKWLEDRFGHSPLAAAMTQLTYFKNNAEKLNLDVLSKLLARMLNETK